MEDPKTFQVHHVLPVVQVKAPDGSQLSRVLCPRKHEKVALSECGRCEGCLGLELNVRGLGTLLKCAWHEDNAAISSPARKGTSAWVGPSVGELMTQAACVTNLETTVEALAQQMLQAGVSAVAVLDAHTKALGIISKTDLLRKYLEDADRCQRVTPGRSRGEAELGLQPVRARQGSVTEVMSRVVFGLSAEASVARAAALMAYEGIHQLVVFNDDASIAGVISALDILRWLAGSAGFAVPRHTEP